MSIVAPDDVIFIFDLAQMEQISLWRWYLEGKMDGRPGIFLDLHIAANLESDGWPKRRWILIQSNWVLHIMDWMTGWMDDGLIVDDEFDDDLMMLIGKKSNNVS